MANGRKQPTPIDEEEYEKFRSFVQDVHGSTRGHLRTEIQNALREYRESYYGSDQLTRIENDIATLMATMAHAKSDGGLVGPTPSEDSGTRARRLSKPAANQPRTDKIEYLTDTYLEKENYNNDSGTIVRKRVKEIVHDEYSFEEEILQEYVNSVCEQLKDRFDPQPHPIHGQFLVWGEKYESAKEEAQKLADEELGEVA